MYWRWFDNYVLLHCYTAILCTLNQDTELIILKKQKKQVKGSKCNVILDISVQHFSYPPWYLVEITYSIYVTLQNSNNWGFFDSTGGCHSSFIGCATLSCESMNLYQVIHTRKKVTISKQHNKYINNILDHQWSSNHWPVTSSVLHQHLQFLSFSYNPININKTDAKEIKLYIINDL